MASIDWTFSHEVVHLLMGVRIILNSWTHADDNSPSGVTCENENGIVDCSKLGVHDGLHLMPLIHLQGVVSNGSRQVGGCISMQSVPIWQLRFIVLTIWLNEGLDVPHWLLKFLLNSIHQREVSTGRAYYKLLGCAYSLEISHLF